MKIILSRKGFDSSAGGVPSPILPDGRILSLPIPDPLSDIRYRDIDFDGVSVAGLVHDLTRGRIGPDDGAHLDPDLLSTSQPREPGWRPLFGQAGAAQGHLRNQGVGPGDLFLFFGLFQRVLKAGRTYRFDPTAPRQHILWGWLQVGESFAVDDCMDETRLWAAYHPHFRHDNLTGNTMYVARDYLTRTGPASSGSKKRIKKRPGAGIFRNITDSCLLTTPDATSPSQWRLPAWLHPRRNRPPLSYHHNVDRWSRRGHFSHLQAASRGQEFVLDANAYPEAFAWARDLIESS